MYERVWPFRLSFFRPFASVGYGRFALLNFLRISCKRRIDNEIKVPLLVLLFDFIWKRATKQSLWSTVQHTALHITKWMRNFSKWQFTKQPIHLVPVFFFVYAGFSVGSHFLIHSLDLNVKPNATFIRVFCRTFAYETHCISLNSMCYGTKNKQTNNIHWEIKCPIGFGTLLESI